jgi:hypothetical protein
MMQHSPNKVKNQAAAGGGFASAECLKNDINSGLWARTVYSYKRYQIYTKIRTYKGSSEAKKTFRKLASLDYPFAIISFECVK